MNAAKEVASTAGIQTTSAVFIVRGYERFQNAVSVDMGDRLYPCAGMDIATERERDHALHEFESQRMRAELRS